MTIIFQYTIPNFLSIIQIILFILSYAFLFYGGRSLQRTRESYIRSDLLIKGGIISIILFAIRLCFPGWYAYNLTPEELQLIFIVVFGIFFMVIGFHNKLNNGYFLLVTGILFILRTIFWFLSYFSINYTDTRSMIIINHFSTFYSVSAMVVFLTYTLLINEKWLSASGICLVANYLISIFYIYTI